METGLTTAGLWFLMGAAMGLSGGKANPALLQRLMDEALEKGRDSGK